MFSQISKYYALPSKIGHMHANVVIIALRGFIKQVNKSVTFLLFYLCILKATTIYNPA